jgi:hypothetical protein
MFNLSDTCLDYESKLPKFIVEIIKRLPKN